MLITSLNSEDKNADGDKRIPFSEQALFTSKISFNEIKSSVVCVIINVFIKLRIQRNLSHTLSIPNLDDLIKYKLALKVGTMEYKWGNYFSK